MKKCFSLFLLNKVKGTELSLSSYQLFDELVPKPLQNGAAPLHNTGIQALLPSMFLFVMMS